MILLLSYKSFIIIEKLRSKTIKKDFYNPNLTFGSIPTTCFRNERPAFFHSGDKPDEVDNSLEAFIRVMSKTVKNDRFTFIYNGKPIMAHPKWIRDHIHELKSFKHYEKDIKSYIGMMCDIQREDGQFYEMVQIPSNYHWTVVNDENRIKDEKNDIVFVRVELEADIEYLMVEGAYQVYQATDDEDWIRSIMPSLEKGINYVTSDKKRWSEELGLCIRPFTIDTWDFVYHYETLNPKDDRNIYYGKTPMSVMHGDNSGVFEAMNLLAILNRRFGNEEKAADWEKRAKSIQENLNKYCWNGKFYTHQLHLNHPGIDGEDETKRLSFSNTYDMNRNITTLDQANKIIEEYQLRRKTSGYFAEWFTIHPPYKQFRIDMTPDHYVNGCIASLAAGELAKAAFNNGHEEYGWDIISRLIELFEKDGELFFLYGAETGKNRGGGPSGWGAAAILSAIEEGLAGIVDTGVKFSTMRFQPRWAVVADQKFGKYITGYEVSDTFVESSYQFYDDSVTFRVACPSEKIDCHILMPKDKTAKKVVCNDKIMDFSSSKVNSSDYVDFTVLSENGKALGSDNQKEYYITIEF